MKIAVYNHQNKAENLVRALETGGAEVVPMTWPADMLLIDCDLPIWHYQDFINRYKTQWGAKIVIYPHGGNPTMFWGGNFQPYEHTDAILVPAEGHKKVLEACGVTKPIHVIGWFLSDVKPFTPTNGKKVLFAANHPDGNGNLPLAERTQNRTLFDALRAIPDIQLRVRYLGTLAQNGLPSLANGVVFERGDYNNSNRAVDWADVVIASGTYGYMAVAKGKPTVMFCQGLGTVEQENYGTGHYISTYRYPYDADDATRLAELMQACQNGAEDWKAAYIGKHSEADEIMAIMRQIAGE